MKEEDKNRLAEARKRWRVDPRHAGTCSHVNMHGGGSLIEETADAETYKHDATCLACGTRIIEVVKCFKKSDQCEVLTRTEIPPA